MLMIRLMMRRVRLSCAAAQNVLDQERRSTSRGPILTRLSLLLLTSRLHLSNRLSFDSRVNLVTFLSQNSTDHWIFITYSSLTTSSSSSLSKSNDRDWSDSKLYRNHWSGTLSLSVHESIPKTTNAEVKGLIVHCYQVLQTMNSSRWKPYTYPKRPVHQHFTLKWKILLGFSE